MSKLDRQQKRNRANRITQILARDKKITLAALEVFSGDDIKRLHAKLCPSSATIEVDTKHIRDVSYVRSLITPPAKVVEPNEQRNPPKPNVKTAGK